MSDVIDDIRELFDVEVSPVTFEEMTQARDRQADLPSLVYFLDDPSDLIVGPPRFVGSPDDPPTTKSGPECHPARSRTAVTALVALAVCAAVAWAILVPTPKAPASRTATQTQTSKAPTPTPPAKANLFDHFATVADKQPIVIPGPGQFLYVDEHFDTLSIYPSIFSPHPWLAVNNDQQQVWYAADGAARSHNIKGAPTPATLNDVAGWKASGSPSQGLEMWAGGPNEWTTPGLKSGSLSSNPKVLHRQLQEAVKAWESQSSSLFAEMNMKFPKEFSKMNMKLPKDGFALFQFADDAAQDWENLPPVRAAIFHLLKQLPGVTVQPRAMTHDGRRGVGVSYQMGSDVTQLVFDPQSSDLLGINQTITDPAHYLNYALPAEALGMTLWTTFSTPVIVDAANAPAQASGVGSCSLVGCGP